MPLLNIRLNEATQTRFIKCLLLVKGWGYSQITPRKFWLPLNTSVSLVSKRYTFTLRAQIELSNTLRLQADLALLKWHCFFLLVVSQAMPGT